MPKKIAGENISKFPTATADIFESKKGTRATSGIALVAKRLNELGKLAPNGQPIEFVRTLLIRKGDVVPKEFRGIPGIKVGPGGIADDCYTDRWCESHWNETSKAVIRRWNPRAQDNWGDTWGECWDNSTCGLQSGKSQLVINSPSTAVRAFTLDEFSSKELKAIAAFGVR